MGFIREDNKTNGNNNNNSEIKTISSKVLATVPASDIKLGNEIAINNVSINKDRRYYIEFLGIKKLCSISVDEELGNAIICGISNYFIHASNDSTNISIGINKINEDDTTTDTFTDLVIYEEEVKYLDSKYLENDLTLQNSISLGRVGDIGICSSAIGMGVTASGDGSHAEGSNTKASGIGSHAEGSNTKASGDYAHAEGDTTKASGDCSHAEGGGTTASGGYSHAEGGGTTASGNDSHAEGASTTASGDGSHAEGSQSVASGESSHAEGDYTTASGDGSHAEGGGTTASGETSHAEGYNTKASSENQHVQGKYNIEDKNNKYAHIVGNGEYNKRSNAHTLDWNGNAWYAGQVEGTNLPYTVSSKKLATVSASNIKLGNEIAINNASINKDRRYYIEFLGNKKLCSLVISEKQGNGITCNIGNYFIQAYNDSANIKIGINKINTDDTTTDTFTDLIIYEEEVKCLDNKYLETDLVLQNSIGIGRIGDIGAGSSAIGYNVEASGMFSHAEGGGTKASGGYSHAEGYNATATGNTSHAEGGSTTATGSFSHAEGSGATASGYCAHAEGNNTIASSMSQHVQGKYNIEDKNKKYAHIVGNGGYNKRSNAHTLDWEGNAWYAGQVEGTNLPYTVSSKVLGTVSASNVKINDNITIKNVSINKDRRYYIELLSTKKLCSLSVDEELGNCIMCSIGNYFIQAFNNSTDIMLVINKINSDDTTDTFTDLIIYEEEVKCLDNKYLENNLVLQNSISLGRRGNIGTCSSAVGCNVEASGDFSHAEGNSTKASGDYSHAEGVGTVATGNFSHAEGYTTKASSDFQHVQGKCNIEDAKGKYAHIVGNGTDEDARSNAHTLDWKGNAWYSGQVYVGGKSQDDGKKLLSTADIYFDENGKLCITINGVTKKFTPDSE